ncbi:hypothetical protein DSO57_1001266 [Entomophthora muscae]|uniref:Uncharacterized protein n=1 Tax=Entomophthora muscae TaxID=34485 RepID=A0ACC2T8M2_9FUNG|nr:hypothetical protein DSO57_1001266 [Entomophthora muscae]
MPRVAVNLQGASFGLVHFIEYPINPAYSEFTLEEILIYNPEARTQETEIIGREGAWITVPPFLFQDKYNYLPAYQVPMPPPLNPWPDCLQESVAANKSTSTQLFGAMYIILTGLVDSMVPSNDPWAILGKFLSYIVKLAPILWWALPSRPVVCLPTSSQEPPMGWIPDTPGYIFERLQGSHQLHQPWKIQVDYVIKTYWSCFNCLVGYVLIPCSEYYLDKNP